MQGPHATQACLASGVLNIPAPYVCWRACLPAHLPACLPPHACLCLRAQFFTRPFVDGDSVLVQGAGNMVSGVVERTTSEWGCGCGLRGLLFQDGLQLGLTRTPRLAHVDRVALAVPTSTHKQLWTV